MTQSERTAFIGVLMPRPLATALKEAAAQRGQTQSDIVRLAVAKDLASMTNPQQKPARPA